MIATPLNKARLGRHVLAYAMAVHFFFGSLSVLNGLRLSLFFYYPRVVRIVIFDAKIDLLVWIASILYISAITATTLPEKKEKKIVQVVLATLSAALALTILVTTAIDIPNILAVYLLFLTTSLGFALLILFRDRVFEQSSKSLTILTLVYLFAFLVTIGVSSAFHYSLQSLDLNTPIGKLDAATELQLSYAPYGLLPYLYAAFLFSWAWVPVVQKLVPRMGKLFEHNPTPAVTDNSQNRTSLSSRISDALDPKLFLVLAIAVFVGYYPYLQNPPWIVGTDAYWRYYDPLIRISKSGALRAFARALSERHPMPLMILYAAHLVLQMSLLDIVRLAQLVLVVVLGFSMWWFLSHKRKFGFGLTVFLLSVLSITTTIGFYSSILANWMALVVWVLFFAYLSYRSTVKLGVVDFIVLLLLSTLILFIHPWTWGVFAMAVVVAAIIGLVQEKRQGLRTAGLLLALIAVDVAFALITISYLSASQGWRVMDALGYYTFVIDNPSSVFSFWDALTWLTRIWSPFFSPLYLAVSIVGVFSLKSSSIKPWCKRLIFGWLFVSAIGSILVAPVGFNVVDPSGSETQLWRLLYITPFSVLAPFGITWLSGLTKTGVDGSEESLPQEWNGRYSGFLVALLGLVGLGLACANAWQRPLLLILFLPIATGIVLERMHVTEEKFLSVLVLVLFLLVAFNGATRALSQLLRDPHNYRPVS